MIQIVNKKVRIVYSMELQDVSILKLVHKIQERILNAVQ